MTYYANMGTVTAFLLERETFLLKRQARNLRMSALGQKHAVQQAMSALPDIRSAQAHRPVSLRTSLIRQCGKSRFGGGSSAAQGVQRPGKQLGNAFPVVIRHGYFAKRAAGRPLQPEGADDVRRDVLDQMFGIAPEPHVLRLLRIDRRCRYVDIRAHPGEIGAHGIASRSHCFDQHERSRFSDDRWEYGDVAAGVQMTERFVLEMPGKHDVRGVEQLGRGVEPGIQPTLSIEPVKIPGDRKERLRALALEGLPPLHQMASESALVAR